MFYWYDPATGIVQGPFESRGAAEQVNPRDLVSPKSYIIEQNETGEWKGIDNE
jgi:hypothetical protein